MCGLLNYSVFGDSIRYGKMHKLKYILLLVSLFISLPSFAWVVVVHPGAAVYPDTSTLGSLKWIENDTAASFRRIYPVGEAGTSGLKFYVNYLLAPLDESPTSNVPTGYKIDKFYVTTQDTASTWVCFDIYRGLYHSASDNSNPTLDSSASTSFVLNIPASSANLVKTLPSVTGSFGASPPQSGYLYANFTFNRVACNSRCTGSGAPYSCCTGAGAGNCTAPSSLRFLGAIITHQ